jgi:hypothetical protein
MVNGTMLSTTAALASTAAVDKESRLTFGGTTVVCTGKTQNAIAPMIQSTNKGSATSLGFTGCTTLAGEKCELVGTAINTLPISLEATLDSPLAVLTTIRPKTGTVFTTILFTGSLCATGGEVQGLTGHVAVLGPTGLGERASLQVNAASRGTELFVGEAPATLEGSALLKLASGLPWSFL